MNTHKSIKNLLAIGLVTLSAIGTNYADNHRYTGDETKPELKTVNDDLENWGEKNPGLVHPTPDQEVTPKVPRDGETNTPCIYCKEFAFERGRGAGDRTGGGGGDRFVRDTKTVDPGKGSPTFPEPNPKPSIEESTLVAERGRKAGDRTGGGGGDRFDLAERGRGAGDRTGGGGGDRFAFIAPENPIGGGGPKDWIA